MLHRKEWKLAALLLIGCLFSRLAQAEPKTCVPATIYNGDGSVREQWMECVGGGGGAVSFVGSAERWVQMTVATGERTQPPAPREGPQPGGGGSIKGTEPIELHGEFTIQETDLVFPGLGSNFQFSRSYSSFSRYFGVMGHGWSHNYERALITIVDGTCRGTLEYVDAQGSIRFHQKGISSYEPDENGNGYRLEKAGQEYVLKDGSGLSYIFLDNWKPYPLPWKPLVAIRDSLGHEQKIAWTPYDEKTWPEAKVASVQDTTGRTIYFNYENASFSDLVQKKTILKCLSMGAPSCNSPLVSFEYNDLEELMSVKDAAGRGNTYTYDHGYTPEKALSAVDSERLCTSQCGSYSDDCRNNVDVCHSGQCFSRANILSCYGACIELYPFQANGQCPEWCSDMAQGFTKEESAQRKFKNEQEFKKIIYENCLVDLFKEYPYCRGSALNEGPYVDAKGFPQFHPAEISTHQECYDQCKAQYETKDDAGNPRFSYGVSQDLNHNIVEIKDGEGRRVIKNQYGTDPAQISFDRVTDQWMGENDSEENHVKLSYYDLTDEEAFAWNEPQQQPSEWGDLLCGTAYAADGASIALPQSRIRIPANTEEVQPVDAAVVPSTGDNATPTEKTAATVVPEPLCSSLCLSEGEDWHNVRMCHVHDHDTPCLSQASGESDEAAKKSKTDACMADFFKEHPDCAGFSLEAKEYASETVGSPQECYKRCTDLFETEYYDGSPRLTYGARLDANHNVIAVYDEDGRRIEEPAPANIGALSANPTPSVGVYTDTSLRSLNVNKPSAINAANMETIKTISPQAPVITKSLPANPSTTPVKTTPKLNAWMGILKTIGTRSPSGALRAPYSRLSPYVQSLSAFNSVTICPQLGDSEENSDFNEVGEPQKPQEPGPDGPFTPPPQLTLVPMQAAPKLTAGLMRGPQIHPAAQVPVMATVLEDLHGRKRTYYLDKHMRLLREVLFSPKGQPYETTDYNYILKRGGMNRAVLTPSGEKVCTVSTIFDLPQSITHSPAPGYAGEQSPKISSLEYDDEGNLTKSVQKGGATVEYVRDNQKRVKQVKSLVDLVKNQTVTVTNTYAADTDVIPSQIVSQGGSVTEQSDFDPWGVQPKKITLDKNGAAPVSTYADYYPTGRIKEAGIWGQKGSSWEYDANFLPKTMKVRKDPNSQWWETSYVYNGANQPKTIETPELTRRLLFDSLGNPVSIDDQPKDKISKEKKSCFHYSPDGRLLAEMYPGGNVAEYAYDPAGRLVSEKIGYPEKTPDWAGDCGGVNIIVSSFVANANPNPNADAKKGMEEVLSLTYKPGGFLQKVRENGVDYTVVTDGYGRVIDRIDPRGTHHRVGYRLFDDRFLWAAAYDSKAGAYGQPNFPDASLQAASDFEYDGLGRPTVIHRWQFADGKPVGADLKRTTQFSYDDAQGITTTTADGASVATKYDGLGRILSQVLPDNSKVTAQWDANLNQVTWNRPGPHGNEIKTTQVFDGLGLPIKIIDDQGRVVLEEMHDALGRVLESRPAASGAVHYTYDSFGRPYQTRREAPPNGDIVLTYLWGANDELLGLKDGNGNLTQSRYDGQGRPVASFDANNREARYEYLPGTSLVQKTLLPDGNNLVPDKSSTQVANEYDAAGLLAKQSIQHGANVVNYGGQTTVREYTYTPLGRMATAKLTDANNGAVTNGLVNTFTYDSLGNVVLEKSSLFPFEIRHAMDPQNRKAFTTINNAVIERSYDKLGRLGGVALDGQPVASFKYVGPGGPVGLDYGNGAAGALTYDNRGHQTDVAVKDKNQGALLSVHMAYGLDGSPRLKQYSIGQLGLEKDDLFQVDGAGRLIAEGSGLTGNEAVANLPVNPANADVAALLDKSPFIQKYSLDPASNWTNVGKIVKGDVTPLTFTPGATNAYTVAQGLAPQYDPAGNLTAFPAQNPTEKYTYNGLGQLLDATSGQSTSGFYYDALGRRVAEMNTRGDFTYYVWDGNELLASGNNHLDPDSFTLNVMTGPNAPLALADHLGKGNKVYLHAGPDGSVLAASDAQSVLIEGYAYTAYGKPTFVDGDGRSEMRESKIGNRFLFQGMVYDNDSGLYLTPARAYKPDWGRWLSPDPIGLAGGTNLYAFVGGRPLRFSDPSGLCGKSNSNPSGSGGDGSSIRAETRSYAERLNDIRQGCLGAPAGSFADCVAEQDTDAGIRKSKNFIPTKTEGQLRRLGEALQLATLPLAFGEISALEAVGEGLEVVEVVGSTGTLAPKAVGSSTVKINRFEGFAEGEEALMTERVKQSVTQGKGITTRTSQNLTSDLQRGITYREQIQAGSHGPDLPLPGEKTGQWLEFTQGPQAARVKMMMHGGQQRYHITFWKEWSPANSLSNPEGGINSALFDTAAERYSFEGGVGFLAPPGQGVVVDGATIFDLKTGQILQYTKGP